MKLARKELRYLSCSPSLDPCDQVNRRDNSTIIYFYWRERISNSIRQSFARQTFLIRQFSSDFSTVKVLRHTVLETSNMFCLKVHMKAPWILLYQELINHLNKKHSNIAFTIRRLEPSKVHSNPEHSLMH